MLKRGEDRPLIWAHRGAMAYAPANTLESFKLALSMGADGIETDVQLTKDKHIVLVHDSFIDDVSNGQGAVCDYTLEELKIFDFGYKFYGERRGIKIPTLEELFELYLDTHMTVNIEIKTGEVELAPILLDITKKYGMEDRVIFSSFNHEQLVNILQHAPNARVAALYGKPLVNMWDYGAGLGVCALHPKYQVVINDEEYFRRCAELGIAINPYTVNSPKVARRLADLGVNAIITNVPDVMLQELS